MHAYTSKAAKRDKERSARKILQILITLLELQPLWEALRLALHLSKSLLPFTVVVSVPCPNVYGTRATCGISNRLQFHQG